MFWIIGLFLITGCLIGIRSILQNGKDLEKMTKENEEPDGTFRY